MDLTAPLYRLVVFDEIGTEDRAPVRELFCKVTGIHPTDATQWIARTPGLWPQPLPEDQTRTLLDGLYDLRVAAEAWRADQFPELNPVRTIHDAACLEGGLRIKGLRGEPTHWVPWDRIELLSAGRIAAEDEYRGAASPLWTSALTMGLRALTPRSRRVPERRTRAARVPRAPVGEVIIVRRDPRIAFRVVENQMNYAALGDRLRPSAAENFPIFLAALCAHATSATLTPPTRAMLAAGNPTLTATSGTVDEADAQVDDLDDATLFASSQALVDYSTHRLLWSWYGRDRDSQNQTQL